MKLGVNLKRLSIGWPNWLIHKSRPLYPMNIKIINGCRKTKQKCLLSTSWWRILSIVLRRRFRINKNNSNSKSNTLFSQFVVRYEIQIYYMVTHLLTIKRSPKWFYQNLTLESLHLSLKEMSSVKMFKKVQSTLDSVIFPLVSWIFITFHLYYTFHNSFNSAPIDVFSFDSDFWLWQIKSARPIAVNQAPASDVGFNCSTEGWDDALLNVF